MKGYKVFNWDWTCRGFKYEVGETYEMIDKPEICKKGFHFCTELKDCFIYYPFDSNKVKIAEIEAMGDIDCRMGDMGDTKHCTNEIKIVREIPFDKLYIQCESVEHWTEGYHDYEDENIIYSSNYKGHPIVDGKIAILAKEEILYPFNDRMTFISPYRYLLSFNIITDVKEIDDGIS